MPTRNDFNPWPHRLALLLACATFPLIWIGGMVTSTEAGMAVPDWPNTYGENMFLYSWQKWLTGPSDLFYEHLHRLVGALVGLISIALCVTLWLSDDRRWMKVLGVVALAAVCFQGALGGLRVIENERTLAMVHGCFGPAFFALTAAIAVFTSRLWRAGPSAATSPTAGKVQWLALVTCLLAYIQLVLGARIRHMPPDATAAAFRTVVLFHLLLAGVLAGHVVALLARVWRSYRGHPALIRPAMALGGLLLAQIALGCATWVANYSWPSWLAGYAWTDRFVVLHEGAFQVLVTTAHVAVGSLVLVSTLVVSLRSMRLLRAAAQHNDVRMLSPEVAL